MLVNEYLNNLYYQIYQNYPLFIFKEIETESGIKFSYPYIKKVKYDKINKILYFVVNKDIYMYISLAKAGNINTKFFNDIIKLKSDMVIVSSLKNLEDLNETSLVDLEMNYNIEGKKVPLEFFEPF